MQPLTLSEDDRDVVLRMLCDTLALAADAWGTVATLRIIAWMDAREQVDGGFLWLAGRLGYQPSKLDDMIRSTLTAPPRRRLSIVRKLKEVCEPAS